MNLYEMDNGGIYVVMGVGILCGILYLCGFAYSLSQIGYISHKSVPQVRRFVWIGIGLIAVVSVITSISFLGGCGPGTWIFVGSLCLIPISLLVVLINIRNFVKVRNADTPLKWRWLAACTAIGIAASPLAGRVINGACDEIHIQQVQPIVTTLQNYNTVMGYYPDDIAQVVQPGDRPTLSCFGDTSQRYDLINCDGVHVFTLDTFMGGWILRYNLNTGNWSKVDFLEGDCSFLE